MADIQLGDVTWEIRPSMADSFGPNRRIYAGGGDGDLPFSNVETDIIEVVIPTQALPTEAAGTQNDLIYLVTTGGTSNKVLFVMYPTIPVLITLPKMAVKGLNLVNVVADPLAGVRIEQPSMVIVVVPYLVAGGLAQQYPLLGAISKTSAKVGS